MPVKIRLARIGRKKVPYYRVVAIDSRKKRDGEFLEDLGTYNGLSGELVTFHDDRLQDWISKGAVLTETVEKIRKQYKKQLENPKKVVKEASKAKKTALKEKKNDAAA